MKYLILILISVFAFSFNLSEKEKEFIKTHQIKCISTPNWPPFNVKIGKSFEGIGVDFWNIVKKRLKIQSECIIVNEWNVVLKYIQEKKADLTISTTITKERKKYAIFSIPYAVFPFVIATKNNVGFIADIHLIKDKKIAVGQNFTASVYVKKFFPHSNIIETKDIYEALKLVKENKAFAVIDVLPVIVYNINKYNFSDLKISGYTPWKFKARFMIRKDYKYLRSAINKAVLSITQKEKNQIYKKWLTIKKDNLYTFEEIFKYLIYILILISALVGWIIFLIFAIYKRKKLEQKLEKLATLDKLTNIYNRNKIDEYLTKQIAISKRYNSPLSVIFFDIDHFKKINDTFGHKKGDFVLKELAKLVRNNIRNSDLFGRWGGEEFIIILPNTTLSEATVVAQKLREIIQNYHFKGVDRVTCSFGVTQLKNDDNIEKLIIRVDNLMYMAKKGGRNRVINDIDKI